MWKFIRLHLSVRSKLLWEDYGNSNAHSVSDSFPESVILANNLDLVLGLLPTNVTAEQEVLGSIPGVNKVLLGFSVRNFLVAVSLDLWQVAGNRLTPFTWDLKT